MTAAACYSRTAWAKFSIELEDFRGVSVALTVEVSASIEPQSDGCSDWDDVTILSRDIVECSMHVGEEPLPKWLQEMVLREPDELIDAALATIGDMGVDHELIENAEED